ncbi:MAG TPA: DinB family protein [Gemmatimonadales bacterium]|jgi:uncharacterized damage-inducible protein DinB
MDQRVAPFASMFGLNTDLLLNCLQGLSESEARQCLPGGGNSMAFLAAHLADSRYFLVERLGNPLSNPLARYLAQARSISDIREWPTLDEIRSAWLAVSAHLQDALAALSAAQLSEPNVHRFPLGDSSRLGLIVFLAQHDSYHLGQVAFLRRQLGKPAMSYARRGQSSE